MKKLVAVSLFAAVFASALSARAVDEDAYKKLMKEAGGAGGRVKKAIEAKSQEAVVKDAERIEVLFKEMAGFWETKTVKDGAKWSHEAEAAAHKIVVAAKAGDFEKAREELGAYQKSCKGCHEAHREKVGEHEYKFKY